MGHSPHVPTSGAWAVSQGQDLGVRCDTDDLRDWVNGRSLDRSLRSSALGRCQSRDALSLLLRSEASLMGARLISEDGRVVPFVKIEAAVLAKAAFTRNTGRFPRATGWYRNINIVFTA